jgi:hypothetical protein
MRISCGCSFGGEVSMGKIDGEYRAFVGPPEWSPFADYNFPVDMFDDTRPVDIEIPYRLHSPAYYL